MGSKGNDEFPFLVLFLALTYTMQFTPRNPPAAKVSPIQLSSDELSRANFEKLLIENPGRVVLKFGATWCGPCQRIESHVHQWFERMPPNVTCLMIDIDESFDLYAAFKSMRQVTGIPAILCFNKGNVSYVPDFSVVGSDLEQVNLFFKRVLG
jgi:thioredoxin-like negative regulator of GroEL